MVTAVDGKDCFLVQAVEERAWGDSDLMDSVSGVLAVKVPGIHVLDQISAKINIDHLMAAAYAKNRLFCQDKGVEQVKLLAVKLYINVFRAKVFFTVKGRIHIAPARQEQSGIRPDMCTYGSNLPWYVKGIKGGCIIFIIIAASANKDFIHNNTSIIDKPALVH